MIFLLPKIITIAETELFASLPDNLTYPLVTPTLFEIAFQKYHDKNE